MTRDHAQPRPGESTDDALDRNWNELLQELRVMQTGVQLLTGLLLTLPFQQRFADLTDGQRHTYLVAVAAAVLSTVLLVAPVPLHRVLFRQRERPTLVTVSHWFALTGALGLAVAVTAVVALVFGVASSSRAGTAAGAVVAGLCSVVWFVGPLVVRLSRDRRSGPASR